MFVYSFRHLYYVFIFVALYYELFSYIVCFHFSIFYFKIKKKNNDTVTDLFIIIYRSFYAGYIHVFQVAHNCHLLFQVVINCKSNSSCTNKKNPTQLQNIQLILILLQFLFFTPLFPRFFFLSILQTFQKVAKTKWQGNLELKTIL